MQINTSLNARLLSLAATCCFVSPALAVTYTDLYQLQLPAGFDQLHIGVRNAASGGQIAGDIQGTSQHAALWSTGNATPIHLNPGGYSSSVVASISSASQVGSGVPNGATFSHAVVWSGTATSAVDLNPSGYDGSLGLGVAGNQQVGYAFVNATGGAAQAMLWTGTAASAVRLHPASGYSSSQATATDGTRQVGIVIRSSGGGGRAALWSGSAASFIDLNPTSLGFSNSFAQGVGGNQQVGFGYGTASSFAGHALLWKGSAASCVDLNPAGFLQSIALSTDGTRQVGTADSATVSHAFLWNGTAASAIDLGALLPAGWSSVAQSINGDLVYGYATDPSFNYHAIAWNISVPEPTAVTFLTACSVALAARRRR